MMHLYDRDSMKRAIEGQLDPQLRSLLRERVDAISKELVNLTGDTEFLIIQPCDTEADIVRHIGFSPLVEPIEGVRFGNPGFHPFWDWLERHDGWFEMIVTFGSAFAYVLFVNDADGVQPELLALCRCYV